MNLTNPKSPRAIAVEVLNRFDPNRNLVGELLNSVIEKLQYPSERQRATDLVFGTVRNHSAIEAVISKLTERPVNRIQAKIVNIIRIGCYELLFCPQRPEYAIVDGSVALAKQLAGRKQTGFVNWILRQITRQIEKREVSLSAADVQKIIPQDLLRGCQLKKDVLPDPNCNPASYLSTAFSLPPWLVDNWLQYYCLETTRQICFGSNRRPSIYLRPNILKTDIEQFAQQISKAGIQFQKTPDNTMLQIKGGASVRNLPGFDRGEFVVQDKTAAMAVRLLAPRPGQKILDMCAAPGTKTTQLAEISNDKATIIAADIDYGRLGMVEENILRSGINSIKVIYKPLEEIAAEFGPFDCVLVDVPCSNTGVLSKRLEVRFRIKPDSIKKLAKAQMKLFRTASQMLKPGGKICYSTCSIQEEENQLLAKAFLADNPRFALEKEQLVLPSAGKFDCDGGYAVLLKAG